MNNSRGASFRRYVANNSRMFAAAAALLVAALVIASGSITSLNASSIQGYIYSPINQQVIFKPSSSGYGYGQCAGTPVLTLLTEPNAPSGTIKAVVRGLYDCAGVTLYIKPWTGCNNRTTIASFVANDTGGSVTFNAPGTDGVYGYWVCGARGAIQGNAKDKAEVFVQSGSTSTIPPTTTITPSSKKTNGCHGSAILTIMPDPASTSSNVEAVVRGLSDCSGTTLYIKPWTGCSNSTTIASFVANDTGGRTSFKLPNSMGVYGYWICSGKSNGKGPVKGDKADVFVI
ncbi:MAG: hypothetical protein KGI06_05535 [Candidatus Micrarchaeota archaeon]|nr:hypothetical protein [Candidatus Micrarchaeota archaeon]